MLGLPHSYPAWWNVEVKSGEYAWKPEVVFEVVRESLVPVVWCVVVGLCDSLVVTGTACTAYLGQQEPFM